MPLTIIRQDITKIKCDAIVNPSDGYLMPEGMAIGEDSEQALLEAFYRNALAIAAEKKCRSAAFPLFLPTGCECSMEAVLKTAVRVIGEFLFGHEMLVYLVVEDESFSAVSGKLLADVTSYVNGVYEDVDAFMPQAVKASVNRRETAPQMLACEAEPTDEASLEEMLCQMDKGFAETLFDFIDAKGMTDVECYKRANVDKKTFSKIKCNKNYKPSKVTAVSFAIALRLNPDETEHLLRTVGMSLSHSSKFDVIIEYFIKTGNYETIFDVNETLYQFGQATLGV